jgi:hypothetical protein
MKQPYYFVVTNNDNSIEDLKPNGNLKTREAIGLAFSFIQYPLDAKEVQICLGGRVSWTMREDGGKITIEKP